MTTSTMIVKKKNNDLIITIFAVILAFDSRLQDTPSSFQY